MIISECPKYCAYCNDITARCMEASTGYYIEPLTGLVESKYNNMVSCLIVKDRSIRDRETLLL